MTSLRGNLSIVDLANILQMLQMNQREGTLHIVGPEGRKAVYFGLDGVSTLNCGPRRQSTIGRILVRNGLITEDQLAEALRRQAQSSGRMLGQIVVEQGLVTRDQIEQALRTQVEEEIYDLFITKDAQFEFLEGELPAELAELRSQNRIAFNVNTLIMEAAQRIDEWEWIQSVVPDTGEIYRYSGVNVPLEDELFSEPAGGRILTAIDGLRNVDELIEASFAGKFQVYKVVALLVQAAALEPISIETLKSAAEQAIADGDTTATIKFLSRLVDLREEDASTHLRLAEAYESERELERAAFHYRVYAETRIERADVPEAFRVYQRIFEILPTDLAAGDRMVEVFSMNPDGLEQCAAAVIQTGKTLAETYVEMGRASRAIQILHRVVSLGPDDTDLRSRLIDVYLQTGMSGEAVAEFEALAEVALAQQEHDRAEQIYRKILTIDPDRNDILGRLNQQISRRTQRRRSVRNSVAVAGVVTILGVALWYGAQFWLDHRADLARTNAHATNAVADIRQRHAGLSAELSSMLTAMASSVADEDELLHEIRDRADERAQLETRVNAAVRELNDAVKEFAGSPAAEDAAAAVSSLIHQIKELDRTREDGVARLAARAQALYLEGQELSNAKAPTRDQYAKFERAVHIGAPCAEWLRKRDGVECQAFYKSLRETIDGLANAQREIEALVADGRVGEAFDRGSAFFESYPPRDIASELRLPVVIESLPSGAEIVLDGTATGRFTPATVLVGAWNDTRIGLRLASFADGEIRILPVEGNDPREIVAGLSRRITASLGRESKFESDPVSGRLEATPELIDGLLIVPTRSANVEVFDLEGTRRVAPFVVRNPSGSRVAVVADGDVVAVFGTDGVVWFHDRESRRFLGALDVPGEVRGDPIRVGETRVVATEEGRVLALDVAARREVWRYPARGARPMDGGAFGELTLVGDALFACDGRGQVAVLDAHSGVRRRTIALRGLDGDIDAVHGVGVDATHIAVVDPRGHVTKLDHRTGAIAWSTQVGSRPAFAPVLDRGRVIVVGQEGRVLFLDAENGAIDTELSLDARPAVAPVVMGDELLIGDQIGRLTAIDLASPTPSVTWRHEVGRDTAIATRPVLRSGYLIFGSDDGRIHVVLR